MKLKPNKVHFEDLGRIDYQSSWDLQTQFHNQLKDRKVNARRAGEGYEMDHHLLFAEHNHVYTLGKSGKIDNLLIKEKELEKENIQFFKINRGGDITYHGVGQITAYPIFDLDGFFTDVHKYVRMLEEVVIDCLAKYDIEGIRNDEFTGVWVKEGAKTSKVCAIGVHLSRWVTMHGLALNVNTDLSKFNHIIPCGIHEDKLSVTSISQLIGKDVDFMEAKSNLKDSFSSVFNLMYL